MSESEIKYALIKNGDNVVSNIIVANSDYSLDGYYIIAIQSGVFCQPNMYYNKTDGVFYYDSKLSFIYPPSPESETS
jgi:hypothetical protein